jgi:hypothetical protein
MATPTLARNETRRIVVATSDESALPDFEQYLAPVFHTTILSAVDSLEALLSLTW